MRWGGRLVRSTHIAFFLKHGRWPGKGRSLNHTCDIRACVNPAHLYEGDAKSNATDRIQRGRHRSGAHTKPQSRRTGEKNGRAKLTEQQVIQIRRTCARHKGVRGLFAGLARKFGVTEGQVSDIVRGIEWRSLDDAAYPAVRPLSIRSLAYGQKRGFDSPHTKLSASLVLFVRYSAKLIPRKRGLVELLHELLGLGRSTISRLIRGQAWQQIGDDAAVFAATREFFDIGENGKQEFSVASLRRVMSAGIPSWLRIRPKRPRHRGPNPA